MLLEETVLQKKPQSVVSAPGRFEDYDVLYDSRIQHDVTLLKIEVTKMTFSVNVRTQKVLRTYRNSSLEAANAHGKTSNFSKYCVKTAFGHLLANLSHPD